MTETKESQAAHVLAYLDEHPAPNDVALTSLHLAKALCWEHDKTVGILNSLASRQKIALSAPQELIFWFVSKEGDRYAQDGTPEMRLVQYVKRSGAKRVTIGDLQSDSSLSPDVSDIGVKNALKQKWILLDKATKTVSVNPKAEPIEDLVQKYLVVIKNASKTDHTPQNLLIPLLQMVAPTLLAKASDVEQTVFPELKKRKLIDTKRIKYYNVTKGPLFSRDLKALATDLTQDIILKQSWKNLEFKPYNFYAAGVKPQRGSVHPLMSVCKKFRKILLSMHFEEMPTEQWVESSFWNFDALFQPQQHPARDAQDTFFLQCPVRTLLNKLPDDYVKRVHEVHEKGSFGSIGWRYPWSTDEAEKNVLRTHTTANSARILYKLAQDYKKTGIFTPKRFFSIDRVFRNETLDATHLAEFHQVEGLICDRGLSLAHLMGVLKTFYQKIGITDLKFKPAFNPYTEPSMEIFGFHPDLKKWIEVGNSGMFRPEMLRPMGFPEDVSVIAWGLSLERPTMIRYRIGNIRELFGHKAILGIA